MTFLAPAAFFLSLLAAGIVALYLQRQKRQPLEVSTLIFWRRVMEREPHRRFLGKLRHPLSLLLQLLILLVLILALARPEPSGWLDRQHTVIVLDTRARMQAAEGQVFQNAVRTALDLVASASTRRPVAVIAVAGAPQLISGFSDDSRSLRDRIGSLQVSDTSGGMTESLALARRLLDHQPGGRLVVISDRPVPGVTESLSVGSPAANAAVLGLAQRPLPASPQSAEVFVKLGNFADSPQDIEMELSLDGRIFDLQTFRLDAGDEQDYAIVVPAEMTGKGAGRLLARLTVPDALATDNLARATLAPGPPVRVLLITEDNPFLEGALKADADVMLEILRPESWRPEMGPGFDAVIFDDFLPPDLPLEGGHYGFLGRSPFDFSGDPLPPTEPQTTEPSHPLLWQVAEESIGPVTTRTLRAPAGDWRVSTPLQAAGEPILLALEKPDGTRLVAMGFGVADSTFPLRAGFPIFINNAVRWLAGRDRETDSSWRTGQTFLPASGESVATRPETADSPNNAPEMTTKPVRLQQNGFYEVQSENGTRRLAVNTFSPEESDLREARTDPDGPLVPGAPGGLLVWQWIALLGLFLLTLEWVLCHRRITE